MIGRAILGCLCLLVACGAPSAEELWVVNAGSEVPLVPAVWEAAGKPPNGPVAAEGAAAADAWDGRLYILGPFRPLQAAKVRLAAGGKANPMWVLDDAKGIHIRTDRGTWQFLQSGEVQFHSDEGDALALRPNAVGKPRIVYAGASLVALRSEAKAVDYRVYLSGVLEVSASGVELSWSPATPCEISLASNLGFALADRGGKLEGPMDWLRIGRRPALHIGWAGGTATADPGMIKLTGTLRIVPGVSDTWASVHAQAALADLVVLDKNLAGSYPGLGGTVAAQDRDKDGAPDFDSDLWLFDKGGDGKLELVFSCLPSKDDGGKRPANILIYQPKGKRLDELKLEVSKEVSDKYAATPFASEVAPGPQAAGLSPTLVLNDWNGDGRFFIGSLLYGGYVQQDRVLYGQGGEVRAFDLDGDGDIDIADWGTSTQLDLEDNFIGMMHVELDPAAGKAGIVAFTPRHSVVMADISVSWYNKTYIGGKFYEGARLGFEEHQSICIPPCDRMPDGAMFHFKTSDDNIDRMTMGRFTRSDGLAWNVELDPIEADREHPDRYKCIAHYADPWGHEFKARTIVYPPKWDGKRLTWEKRPEHANAWEIYPNAPWYRTTTGKYFPLRGVHAAFTPEGSSYGSNEGMYGGALSHLERVEDDVDGADFTLYYSSLLGGLHLKGADYGHTATPVGYPGHPFLRKEWYHYPNAFVKPDARGQGLRSVFQPEGKRLEGPLFLHYVDRDKDGYFDTYVYDADNDGLIDKTLWYDAKAKHVAMQQGGRLAVWPYHAEFTDVAYQFINYEKIRQLWRRGMREEAMIERFNLASSGVPIERQRYREEKGTPLELETTRRWRPDFFAVFGPEWLPKIAVFEEAESPGRFGWTDFKPTGFTRLGTVASLEGLVQQTIRGEISEEALRGVSIFLIGHLSHVVSERELAALLEWVEAGGTLVLHYTSEEAIDRLYLNALGERLGFQLGDLIVNRTVVSKLGTLGSFTDLDAPYVEERIVTPDNRIEHYKDLAGRGFLDGLSYLSFVGSPLKVSRPMEPVFTWKGQTMMARAKFGKGIVVVIGMNALSDAHTKHNELPEPGTQNDLLLQRMAAHLADRAPRLIIEACRREGNRATIAVKGRGGQVSFPRLGRSQAVKVDGQAVEPGAAGALSAVTLPAGEHTIEVEPRAEVKK
jgi:hypothetical protein